MPRRKSAHSTLQVLCAKTVIHHIAELQDQAKLLPTCIIDELYNVAGKCYYEKCSKCMQLQLPSNLFFHPNLTKLRYIGPNFDLMPSEIALNILSDCKKLQSIDLHHSNWLDMNLVLTIIISNPLITYIDLSFCRYFTDQHLFLTSKHCPQLQHLNLNSNYDITDKCMDYLPINLTYLNVTCTRVTPNGCLVALKRLKYLKKLKRHEAVWSAISNLLTSQRTVESNFAIESLEIACISEQNFKISILDMLPKLSKIKLYFTESGIINSLIENKRGNLITRINGATVSLNTLRLIGWFCPALKELYARFSSTDPVGENSATTTVNQVPFKHLRKLTISAYGMVMQLNDIKPVLINCKELWSLSVYWWRHLEDQEIYDLLKENPLLGIDNISFRGCNRLTIAAFTKLIDSLESLKEIYIYDCENLSNNEYEILQDRIDKMNWDMQLYTR